MKTDARPPPKDPFIMDVKATAWKYAVGAVAAFAVAAVLLEGPATAQFERNDDDLIVHRFDSKQQNSVLTEDKVRAIVKEEVQQSVRPMLQQQLEEIRRMLPPQKPHAHP
jgi:hypothetical protein